MKKNPHCIVLMEFVPHLYKENGKLFLQEIFHYYAIGFVDYEGKEHELTNENFILKSVENFWMLTLRYKNPN